MLKVDKKNQGGQRNNKTVTASDKKGSTSSPAKADESKVKPAKLDTLKSNPSSDKLIDIIERMKSNPEQNSPAKQNESQVAQIGKKVAFVAPLLPHHCELEIWNNVVRQTGVTGVVLTADQQERAFQTFVETCNLAKVPVALSCKTLETTLENKSFLGGLENEIRDADLVVAVGEASLATYQAMKARRSLQNRLLVWQNAPRPPSTLGLWKATPFAALPPQMTREKTIRREVLKTCDAIISLDKEGATWAYLEEVNPQRIRRINRGVNTDIFNLENLGKNKNEIRKALGLSANDFIFMQTGPLEIDSGALDTVYAFKSLIQSHTKFTGKVKLLFCSTGASSADVRQAVVDLQLEDHVFFLNPSESGNKLLVGNQLSPLIAACDTLIHSPLAPSNGSPHRYLDTTYDVLCGLACGVTVISNGFGWAGEFAGRFYKTFAGGNIHSLCRTMFESVDKREKLTNVRRAAFKAVENELNFKQSVDEFSKIISNTLSGPQVQDSNSIESCFEQIEKTIQGKQYLDAIHLINKAFTMDELTTTQRANLFRHIGDCFTKLGDLENGLANYTRALELDPYCGKSLIGLGTVALQQHNYNVAVPQFQKAVGLSPRDDMASLGLGLAFEGLGELEEARRWTSRACTLNIENTVAIFNLVKLAYDTEVFSEAEEVVSRYVGLHPHDINMVFTLGGIAFRSGKLEEATKLMENILILDPMNSRAHSLMAQIQKRGDTRRQA
ncbi:MAG: tetratricopeptide repeat protein [Silvanigrellaceae bacterium]